MPQLKKSSGGTPFIKPADVVAAIKSAGKAIFTPTEYRELVNNFAEGDDDKTKPGFVGDLRTSKKGDPATFLWSPNQTSINSLIDKWGEDTDKWLGKQVELIVKEYNMKDTIFTPEAAEELKNRKPFKK